MDQFGAQSFEREDSPAFRHDAASGARLDGPARRPCLALVALGHSAAQISGPGTFVILLSIKIQIFNSFFEKVAILSMTQLEKRLVALQRGVAYVRERTP